VELDRQSIEKKDFPVGRRGYDPDAVDAHLSVLADAVAEFKQAARRRSDTLASSASEQVRAIVQAAESSAADIQREAEQEAREIREEAGNEARATREHASEEARDYIGRVSESTNAMLQRLDAMEQELNALVEALRTGSHRLSADLQTLQSDLHNVEQVVVPPGFEPEAEVPLQAAATPAYDSEPAEPAFGQSPVGEAAASESPWGEAPAGEAPAGDAPAGEAAEFHEVIAAESLPGSPEQEGGTGDEAEGARLIALNMALNGTPREETARYLSENFQLVDAGGLLDEVYSSVGD